MVTGVGHICIGVEDLDRATEFYTKKLGFEFVRRMNLPSGAVLVRLTAPAIAFFRDPDGVEIELLEEGDR